MTQNQEQTMAESISVQQTVPGTHFMLIQFCLAGNNEVENISSSGALRRKRGNIKGMRSGPG